MSNDIFDDYEDLGPDEEPQDSGLDSNRAEVSFETKTDRHPSGFSFNANGELFYTRPPKSKDDKPRPIWLAQPFKVVARSRDPEGLWGLLLEWEDPDNQLIQCNIQMSYLHGRGRDTLWTILASQGLNFSTEDDAKRYFIKYLASKDSPHRVQMVSRLGWQGDENIFMLGDTLFGVTDKEYLFKSRTHNFNVRGNLEEWQEHIGRYCLGNSRLILAVSTAFTPPLLRLVNEPSGGFHLVGESRDGKTTTLYAAGSVCGGGNSEYGYANTWRATANGIEGICEMHSDMLLILDEMGQVKAEEAGEVAYMVSNGSGKRRANTNGDPRPTKQWCTILLSSGEISLADKMAEIGKNTRGGQEVRLVDLPANAGKDVGVFENIHGFNSPGEFAEYLGHAAFKYYGTPIRAFLGEVTEKLMNGKEAEKLVTTIREFRNAFIDHNCPPNASGQVRSVCGRFGLIAVAGEMATDAQITGWAPGTSVKAATQCFHAWLEHRGTSGNHDTERAIETLRSYLLKYGMARFEDITTIEVGYCPTQNRTGWRQETNNGWVYFIHPNLWNELLKGYKPTTIAKEMRSRGFLEPGTGNCKYQRSKKIKKQTLWVYQISPSFLSNGAKQEPLSRAEFVEQMMRDPEDM